MSKINKNCSPKINRAHVQIANSKNENSNNEKSQAENTHTHTTTKKKNGHKTKDTLKYYEAVHKVRSEDKGQGTSKHKQRNTTNKHNKQNTKAQKAKKLKNKRRKANHENKIKKRSEGSQTKTAAGGTPTQHWTLRQANKNRHSLRKTQTHE